MRLQSVNNTQKIAFSNASCETAELSSVEKHQLCVSERRKEYIFKSICIVVHMTLLALSRTLSLVIKQCKLAGLHSFHRFSSLISSDVETSTGVLPDSKKQLKTECNI